MILSRFDTVGALLEVDAEPLSNTGAGLQPGFRRSKWLIRSLPLSSAGSQYFYSRVPPKAPTKSVRLTVPPMCSCPAPKNAPTTWPSSSPTFSNPLP